MIVSFNTNYNFTQRTNTISPTSNVNFKNKNLAKAVHSPVVKDIVTIDKAMTVTEVLDKLRILQKEYKHNWNSLSEYTVGEFIDSVDLDNAQRHLNNLEKLLKIGSNRVYCACGNGFFSSLEGADALDFVIKHFNSKGEEGDVSATDVVFTFLSPQEVLKIKDRKLVSLNKNNNSWSDKIKDLAELSDEEYSRYLTSGQDKLRYLSLNDKINELLHLLVENKDSWDGISIKNMRTFDNVISKDLLENPNNESEIMSFYTRLAKDKNYNASKLDKIFSNPEELNLYRKVYTYLERNGLTSAKPVIIKDSSIENYYEADGIVESRLTKSTKDSWEIAIFDGNGDFVRYNSATNKNLEVAETVTSKDSSRKFNAKLEKINETTNNIIESAKEIFDSNGNLICTERYIKSESIPNKYDIYREFSDGKKYKIGLAEVSKNGNIVIEKTLTTSKGMKTDYNYVEAPDGSRLSYTRITDANGKVIAENKYKYQILDDCHFKTTENGTEYYIQYNDSALGNYVRVTSSDGRQVTLPIGNNFTLSSGVLSKRLLPLLKRMPGSFYFDIDKFGLKKIGLEIDCVKSDSAHYNQMENLIAISEEWMVEDFTLAHEIGHFRDKFRKISKNPDVIESYLKEREIFMKNETQYETHATDYMLNATPRKTQTFVDSLEELVAEVNAFLYASNSKPAIEMRGQFVQEHFPETFAKIANLLLQK